MLPSMRVRSMGSGTCPYLWRDLWGFRDIPCSAPPPCVYGERRVHEIFTNLDARVTFGGRGDAVAQGEGCVAMLLSLLCAPILAEWRVPDVRSRQQLPSP
ncbi:hypothetical protein GCM10010289_75940 [Streptomyces violascens]|uniref:Uncharacterized protein n=1 Tax=Streptomyces violascens TaxID=67381 RepID=A0ABQ3QV49_9ACTN|nr:hypothetical protein GCM10010289_75940 [Streptomyces violascens]GHI41161.1 hypothetical protein Sviol_55690 [Streptomyces violascens]